MKATKPEIIKALADELGVSQSSATHLIETYQKVILDMLDFYDAVKVADLVWIEKREVQGRYRKMPNGEEVYTDPHIKLKAVVVDKYKKF